MSVTEEQIDEAVIDVGRVDYLDLWAITRLLTARFGDELELDRDACTVALDSVERLLRSDVLRAGNLDPPGEFAPWPEQGEVAIREVRERAARLHGALNVGDVGWFELVE
jgi:hypothetical protein